MTTTATKEENERLVSVFAALGDVYRQSLLEELVAKGQASATALAESMPVTRQAVVKHLQVMERAGLVSASREGRQVLYTVRHEQLRLSASWLDSIAANWERRLDRIKSVAEAHDDT